VRKFQYGGALDDVTATGKKNELYMVIQIARDYPQCMATRHQSRTQTVHLVSESKRVVNNKTKKHVHSRGATKIPCNEHPKCRILILLIFNDSKLELHQCLIMERFLSIVAVNESALLPLQRMVASSAKTGNCLLIGSETIDVYQEQQRSKNRVLRDTRS